MGRLTSRCKRMKTVPSLRISGSICGTDEYGTSANEKPSSLTCDIVLFTLAYHDAGLGQSASPAVHLRRLGG